MDTAIGFLFASLVLAGWFFGLAYLYRHRRRLSQWLNDPTLTAIGTTKREQLLRRKIEDCQEELEEIEKNDAR